MTNTYSYEQAKWQKVTPPSQDVVDDKIILNEKTMQQRIANILLKMKDENLDVLILYADLEHGSNFEYLTGFLPRFEEALLVLHKNGDLYYLLGNENLKLAAHAHHKGTLLHVPQFSLPNQPMYDSPTMAEIFRNANIKEDMQIGIVGWKNFTITREVNESLFDLPYYVIQALHTIVLPMNMKNMTSLFIGDHGVRTMNNANEIVHYAYGSQLASKAILQAMDQIEVGKQEVEIASYLELKGQPKSVVTIAATGQRFTNANIYPTSKQLALKDTFSMTVGYKGGLQSRAGYICKDETELPSNCKDYMERLVKPYFTAVCAWIENIHIGMSGNDMYQLIERVIPKKEYGWSLCPGHLIANEEWMASPIYDGSKELLKSGMLLQIDIIPSIEGYAGISSECGIALADEQLKKDLKEQYPTFYEQCENRKTYLSKELGIQVSNDVVILSNAVLYCRPFLLNKEYAMTFNK